MACHDAEGKSGHPRHDRKNGLVKSLQKLALVWGAVESLRPTLVPRNTLHQALVTGACVATTGLAAAAAPAVRVRAPKWLVPAALAVAGVRAVVHVRSQRRSFPDWDPRPQNTPLGLAAGVVAGLAVVRVPRVSARLGTYAGASLAARYGGPAPLWTAAVATAAGAGLAGLLGTALSRELADLRATGLRADPPLTRPPGSPYVSGGPGSLVDYDTLARDGRRFVWFRTPADQIRTVSGEAEEPVRVYVGVRSAPTVEQRVELAMAELERLGGLGRSNLLVMSPAGSGYADYVAAEAFECLTGGDCATVAIQYGVLPSMWSLAKVPSGARTVRTLLDRIATRVAGSAHQPRVLLYGESLGAEVAQDALRYEPSRVDDAARVRGLDAVICVGTPGGRSLRNDLLHSPDVVHLDRWQQLTGAEQATLWFLDHDADPVAHWDAALAFRPPAWLRRRGRNVPAAMSWRPVLTWWQVAFDLVFAAQQASGVFRSVGHDYRADLPHVLAAAIGRDADLDPVISLLAQREVHRDALLAETTASSLPH